MAINPLEVITVEEMRRQCEIDHDDYDPLLTLFIESAVDYALSIIDDPGLTESDQIPKRMRQAIMMLVAHWFANREAVVIGTITAQVPLGVDTLLWTCRNFYGGPIPVEE